MLQTPHAGPAEAPRLWVFFMLLNTLRDTVTRLRYIQPLHLSAAFKNSVKRFYTEIKIQSGVGAKQQKNRHSDILTHDGFFKSGNTNIQLTCETQSQKEAL